MSPREKGRYLREREWRSFSYAGVLSWRDPENPSGGAVPTSVAYERQQAREKRVGT